MPCCLAIVAGVVALVPLVHLLRRSVPGPRLIVEAFVTTIAVIGAFWFGWLALWLIEQR